MKFSELKYLYAELKNPGAEFRSLPFWAWNSRMQHDELRRQIQDMRDKGLGGSFIHSRDGLETPYLSDEWLEDVAVSADESAKQGLELWIYDEDKWPSGSAGGLVSKSNPVELTAKALTLEILPSPDMPVSLQENEKLVSQVCARIDGRRICSFDEGDARIVLRREISRPSEWYNGYAPSDNLNERAMQRFLELTHESYKAYFSGDFKDKVTGFFTDEPNCYDFFSHFTPGRPWLPWTDDFIAQFELRRGYDPRDRLCCLFFDGEGCEKIRHDYWRTITELFGERCLKQMYDWCENNNLRLTGHMLYENDLCYNIRVCGAAMPQYRYLHAPGIDLLGEQCREYLTVKQTTSAANQYGRDMVITETYGCTGWEFDFEGQKWLGDWQFVMGVTRRCQHLMQYSISGCRKRDYPPVFSYQNTWWKYNKLMEDYYARLGGCVTTGKVERDILVIHPISSLWTKCASDPNENLDNIEMNMGWKDPQFMTLNAEGDSYNRLVEALVRAHWDFDFGDETILAECAKINGNRIVVGESSYDTVIVPPIVSLFSPTLTLLNEFADHGGRIIWMGGAPVMVEGREDARAAELYNRAEILHADESDALLALLEQLKPDALRVKSRLGMEDENILTMLRRAGKDSLLVAVNHSRTEAREVCFHVPAYGRVIAYDPWTDSKRTVKCQASNGKLRFVDNLNPVSSVVYFIEADAQPMIGEAEYIYRHPHRADAVFAALGPVAKFKRTMPNALTLDICRFSMNGEKLSDEMEVWQAQRIMRDRLGMQQVYYNGIPQRYSWLDAAAAIPGADFIMEFEFDVDDVPENPCRFAIEKPDGLSIAMNGEACRRTDAWFVDRAIALYDLPKMQQGRNIIRISGHYTAERELEDVFLLGDFGVSMDRRIIREPKKLHFGDWCLQGYPHYAGSMVYEFEIPKAPNEKRIVLRMGAYAGVLAELRINGKQADVLFGQCRQEADLTDFVVQENNLLEIEVCGTPRNLFGPFHQAYDGCSRISWEDFRTEGALHCDGYTLQPYGLMGQISLRME